jgi:hypothetical protein
MRLVCVTALMVAPSLSFAATGDTGKNGTIPDFSSNAWQRQTMNYQDPPGGGHGPVHFEKAHPFVERGLDAQGHDVSETARVGEWRDPVLKPGAAAAVKHWGDEELKGNIQVEAQPACRPLGVPLVSTLTEPVFILQQPDKVTMIYQRNHEVRHVYLNVGHSAHPAPSYYGESIGHYEGGTLVVDTIGMNAKTLVDNYGTPHSDRLHVVERYRLRDGGRTLEDVFTVDDPASFNYPWTARMSYSRVNSRLIETICAENNFDYVTGKLFPIPVAGPPDF